MTSAKIWKDTGKPRAELIFSKYKQDKLLYKRLIREERAKETSIFTNDLYQALLQKSGQTFGKCWKSKFGKKSAGLNPVNGMINASDIANNFAKHFEKVCTPVTADRNNRVKFLQNVRQQITLYAHYLSVMPQENCCACSANERNIIERIIQSGFAF